MTVGELMRKLSYVPSDTMVEIYDGEMGVDPWHDILDVDYISKEQFDDPENDESHREHSVFRIR